jgi:hypothetical protein
VIAEWTRRDQDGLVEQKMDGRILLESIAVPIVGVELVRSVPLQGETLIHLFSLDNQSLEWNIIHHLQHV